jgi:hypothetical protein
VIAKGRSNRHALCSGTACVLLICGTGQAHAFTQNFDNGVIVRLDNTIEYSVAERIAPVNTYLGGKFSAPNSNDGDDNLRAGIISNRVDLITQFDISDNGYGFDTSLDSFYDTVYNQKTQNTSGATYNPASTPDDKFTSATETQAGRNIELRNLFVYGAHDIDGIPVTFRIGRLNNLFGESLLFAGNGIAYGESPIDVERASSVPNTQAKDLFLPVGQVLISAQVSDSISVSAYYKFEWEKFNFIPSGSYFSTADLLDAGGQRIYAKALRPYISPESPGEAAYFYRGKDISGSNNGQFGIALHYDPLGSAWDFGVYALQYNDPDPKVYTELKAGAPTPVPSAAGSPAALDIGNYQLVYADHIQIYGASTSTTVGPLNLAGELSVRANEDLNSSVTLAPGKTANNSNAAAYAIGDVLHYQVSEVYLGAKKPGLWDASSIIGEAAGENLMAITANKSAFATATSQHMALGIRTVASVTYFEVVSGLDVSPNIGLGWNFMGKSPDTGAFNNTGIDRGGDITFGISTVYLNKWIGGVNYTRYIAPPGRDPYADRDFASINVKTTF